MSQYVTQTDLMDLIYIVHAVICSCTMFPCPFIDREVHQGSFDSSKTRHVQRVVG